ncbi:MAG: winged helix-turn-helix transcriptional regulator [Peptococcaceae bacterium]|nr:winged helix-turn-helix transcriptional regulator [Peptococcaceae bacterium]
MDADYKKYTQEAELLKALAHPVRLCIVWGLLEESECNVSHMTSCLNLPQSTVSQQLAILRSRGIIEGERRGTEVCYRVVDHRAASVVKVLLGEK